LNQGYAYREQLGPEAAGLTVLAYLRSRYRHSSSLAWQARIEAGEITVDGARPRASDLVRAGQVLVWRRPPWEEPDVPLAFAVLHRDAHLLAVAKPRGLPSVPAGGFLTHTLLHRVWTIAPSATPLHRLGRGTSGLVLFALSDVARRAASAAWRDGKVEKVYRALVAGEPAPAFSVDAPIGRVSHPRLGTVHAAAAGGRPALTHVRRIGAGRGGTIVEATIPTGRPHQIRIHLAAAGCPLVGDPLYVAGGGLASDPGLPGQGGYRLHAHRLALEHPATGGRLELECAPPPDLRYASACSS
jgi:23S rRNA pseudouridine1911/1915/1917 synthase